VFYKNVDYIKEVTTTGKRQDVFFIKTLEFIYLLVTSSSFYKNVDYKNVEYYHMDLIDTF
jgi:hypothetical protein